MSNLPGVEKTLDLLDNLRRTVREFVSREEKLRQDLAAGLDKVRRRSEYSAQEESDRRMAEIIASESAVVATKQQLNARYERWDAAINRAYKNCRPRRIKAVDEWEKNRKSEVQEEFAESNRRRDEEWQQAETDYQTVQAELAAEQEALERVRDRARRAFRGFGKFARALNEPSKMTGPDSAADEHQLLGRLRKLRDEAETKLRRFRASPLTLLFRWLPVWLLVLLAVIIHAAGITVFPQFGLTAMPRETAAISLAVSLVAILGLYFLGRRLAAPEATAIVTAIQQAQQLHDACANNSAAHHQQQVDRIKSQAEERTRTIQAKWKQADRDAVQMRNDRERRTDQQVLRMNARNEKYRREEIERLEKEHSERVARLRGEIESLKSSSESQRATEQKRCQTEHEKGWEQLVTEWQERVPPIFKALEAATDEAKKLFPDWSDPSWKDWSPPAEFAHAAQFARMEVDVAQLCGGLPEDKRLALPGPARLEVPLLLTIPRNGSLLLETKGPGRDELVQSLNNIILRLLSVTPPGRVNFTIIDPVELGQNFAGLMHLADYEERLITSRIWTQAGQIEEQLARLNEHIEKVTQMYLRNEYETITEYNEQAGRIAEKFHFLVVADFPVNFSDTAARRLMSIAASGPRCGVYTLVLWDQRKQPPVEFAPDELQENSSRLQARGDGFAIADRDFEGTTLRLDAPPDAERATEFLQQVGQASIDSSRVEMPFAEIAPPESGLWSLDTTNELRVAIGRTGATKQQYLSIGKGTRQHALVAGKTGSGKSTLFHVLITNLSLWCGPEQVEFYLVDFKKGVEFKCYATHRLPHARVVAIESDREFGLSVLQRVDEELKRRGDLFRKLGVQDVAGYKKAGGTEPLPRTLLLIDEFQEFFVEDDQVAQAANLLLDRIVRQGRAFGIHALLGSQTLGGAYTLARSTLGQMVVRIALQCNEADAYLIMDDENPAPRLLSRPGEAIYNDAAGAIEGNSPFQIVWLPEEERDHYLLKTRELAAQRSVSAPAPIVFEGNAPADVRENDLLRQLLASEAVKPVSAARAWLGAPNSIKGPTEAVFHRQSGNSLLIVGQRDEAALAMLGVSLVSLAAQHPRGAAKFVVLDCSPPDSSQRSFLERIVQAVPHEITLGRGADIEEIMTRIADELEKRSAAADQPAPATYVFVLGLQRFKKLRLEEDFGFTLDDKQAAAQPGAQFNRLVREGPSLGMHVLCTCDTLNNVNRFLGRKALGEFELRVLFQMSANDSATLIDSPKAGNLGLHRAILFNEQEGYLETFRPYAVPGNDWIEEAAQNLKRLAGVK